MRVAVCYFTGTGNTATAAREIADRFGPDNPTDLYNIELLPATVDPDFLARYDLVGLGSPVYAYNEPPAFTRFLRELPPGNGKPSFLFMTAGQDPEACLAQPVRTLRRKGYDLRATVCLFMPGNVGCYWFEGDEMVFRFLSPTRRFSTRDMERERRERIDRLVRSLLDGKTCCESITLWQRFVSGSLRGVFHHAAAPLMKLLPRTTGGCNLCGICVQVCPTRSISILDRRVRFSPSCTVCVRCLNVCPEHAIRVRWPLSVLNRPKQYLSPGWSPPQHD
ncbi:MAG: EFR1 family ferrodoxin [candidate division WOR-3 bacterium]|nr:MAG: EFR1 family ferrodoxin [candidate division WOR-3 bacterium]